jgi:serine/threonine protein kinase
MQLGRYQVIGTLGSGGMSKVSLGRAPGGELVVLKRQHSPVEDPALYDEARLGIRLFHPHIVDHLDLFEHEGRPVLVVEYVSGATLADLKSAGPLPVPMILRIGQQIADALHYIHTATEEDGTHLGMLHRDVTPANIIVGHDGNARLIDFGIARSRLRRVEVTQEGVLKGTLRYLAPELLSEGDAVATIHTDLWGLGMSLWESALGRYAVQGDDPQIFASIITGRTLQLAPGESIDPTLRGAVAQLLSSEPRCRPQTAHHAAMTFAQYLPMFTNTEQVCRQTVLAAVGPPVEHRDATSVYDRHQLVNRAAATYGGPLGDWALVEGSDIAQPLSYELSAEGSAERSMISSQGPAVPLPAEEQTMDFPPTIIDPSIAPAAAAAASEVSSAAVPAPVELPSIPDRPMLDESTDEFPTDPFARQQPPPDVDDGVATESIDMDALRASRQAPERSTRVAELPPPPEMDAGSLEDTEADPTTDPLNAPTLDMTRLDD